MGEFYLLDCARVIEDEITAKATQPEIAKTYALAMRSENAGVCTVDWRQINAAILKRWSMAGLVRVKMLAHRGMPV